jgi:polysaccharide biosynthesis protein PslG
MKRILVILFVLAVVLAGYPLTKPAEAHTFNSDVTYFPETQHNLAFGFRIFWDNHGALPIFGFPLTEEVSEGGRAVQYFERAVFEYHQELAGTPFETQGRLLGRLVTAGRENEPPFQPITPFPSNANFLFFPETGHSVAFGFKFFWQNNGGLPTFGFPISEEFLEKNADDGQTYTVQYFERARFEYHPEFAGTPFETELGRLGAQFAARLPASSTAGTNPIVGPPPTPTFPMTVPHLSYGMNVWLLTQDAQRPGADPNRVLGLVRQAGFGWARQPLDWALLEPARGQFDFTLSDFVVNSMLRNNLHMILTIHRSPSWATFDGGSGFPAFPTDFQNFMTALASRYRGLVDAYEIWNEENIANEIGGPVNPAGYVPILQAGFQGVKAGDPSAVVIFGGLTPTGVNDPNNAVDDALYLQQIYGLQGGVIKNFFDVLGVHPGGNNNPPDTLWPSDPGPDGWSDHPSFYFRRVENLRDIQVAAGDGNKQIWLTEFGWTTANAAPGFEYGAQVSDQDQAQFLVRAYQKALTDYPWMGVMCLWNLNYSTVFPPTDEKSPWSVITADFSPRPAYQALASMPKSP